jgi:HEAT repeat protein
MARRTWGYGALDEHFRMIEMKPRQIAGLVALGAVLIAFVCVYWPGGNPDSSDTNERLRVITKLSGKTDAESVDTLVRLTRDPKPHVSILAVKALAAAPKSNYVPLLQILDRTDNTAPVRAEVVAALGKCPKPNVPVTVLTKVLTSDADAQVRAGAARGLARRRDKTALKDLVAALEDPDPRVRLWAVTAISRTTALRFVYDYRVSPSKQKNKIRVIKETLRQRTSYK